MEWLKNGEKRDSAPKGLTAAFKSSNTNSTKGNTERRRARAILQHYNSFQQWMGFFFNRNMCIFLHLDWITADIYMYVCMSFYEKTFLAIFFPPSYRVLLRKKNLSASALEKGLSTRVQSHATRPIERKIGDDDLNPRSGDLKLDTERKVDCVLQGSKKKSACCNSNSNFSSAATAAEKIRSQRG